MGRTPPVFRYGQNEIRHLTKADPLLGEIMDRIGLIEREITPDLFTALLQSVISQQISGRAADTIWTRFAELIGSITPAGVLAVRTDSLRACGISGRKVHYMQEIAKAVEQGSLDLSVLPSMDDSQVVEHLIRLPGIGPWTAEMMLLFSLERPDVLSWNDLGIRRGFERLYGKDNDNRTFFENRRKAYSPYGSTASLYLWALSVEPAADRNEERKDF